MKNRVLSAIISIGVMAPVANAEVSAASRAAGRVTAAFNSGVEFVKAHQKEFIIGGAVAGSVAAVAVGAWMMKSERPALKQEVTDQIKGMVKLDEEGNVIGYNLAGAKLDKIKRKQEVYKKVEEDGKTKYVAEVVDFDGKDFPEKVKDKAVKVRKEGEKEIVLSGNAQQVWDIAEGESILYRSTNQRLIRTIDSNNKLSKEIKALKVERDNLKKQVEEDDSGDEGEGNKGFFAKLFG